MVRKLVWYGKCMGIGMVWYGIRYWCGGGVVSLIVVFECCLTFTVNRLNKGGSNSFYIFADVIIARPICNCEVQCFKPVNYFDIISFQVY